MENKKCESCKNEKNTYRADDEKKKLINRLNRISGQINGIKDMIENDRYCNDILIQVAAVQNAIKSMGNQILEHHLKTCVIRDVKNGDDSIMDEVMNLVNKLR